MSDIKKSNNVSVGHYHIHLINSLPIYDQMNDGYVPELKSENYN